MVKCAGVASYRSLAYDVGIRPARMTSLEWLARKHRIPVLPVQGRLGDDLLPPLRSFQPDLICVASFNQLIGESILSIPRCGTINMHPSLLPYYPGPNPWFRMIMNNETQWGVTIHFVDKDEDTGDIIYQSRIEYSETDDGKTLYDKVVDTGASLMVRAAHDILCGQVVRKPQPKVEDRLRGGRPSFDDLIIQLKPTAGETYCFLNRLLFFLLPVVEVQGSHYRVEKILRYHPKSGNMHGVMDATPLLRSNKLRFCFDDGIIELRVSRVSRDVH
jgi:folate-dependent phosphoribosylglycinamide formyltransferase PurN